MLAKTRPWSRPVDQMDVWLESEGFYRKHTARDASCLFRVVAEQLFFTQVYHSDIRRATVEFMMRNPKQFQWMVDEPIDIYAERMRSSKEFGGKVEIEALSKMYSHDFIMYEEIGQPPVQFTKNGFDDKLILCHSLDRHYDSVFTKDFISKAAFCQSIVYEALYKSVFGLKEVDYAITKMLHDKANNKQRESLPFIDCFSLRYEMRDTYTNVRDLLEIGITPFPYKVAKSLDPEVYRNVEYDTWNDYRKGLRYGFCTWNCRELQVGVKCAVNFDDNTKYIGHIQEMAPNKGPVVVYIEKIGEMMTVPYKSLEMLPSPPVILGPVRSPPGLNFKYSSMMSSIGIKKGYQQDEHIPKVKRPNKLNFGPKHKPKEEIKVKTEKPQDLRREHAQVQDSKSHRPEFNDVNPEEEVVSPQNSYPRQVIEGAEGPVVVEKQETISQIYMPIEGSRNHVYIINPQPITHNQTIVQDNRTTYVSAPIQINLMAQKSSNIDGSDLPHSDVQTLRFCYNLGVDCMRMNYLTWNIKQNSQIIVNTTAMVPAHQNYYTMETPSTPMENIAITDGAIVDGVGAQSVSPHPTIPNLVEVHHSYAQPIVDNSEERKATFGNYDGMTMIQHPEITSTTPTTPGTPVTPGAYYYPFEMEPPVCVPTPYMEYVYEVPATMYQYPMSFVTSDGVIYQPIMPTSIQTQTIVQSPQPPPM